MHQSLPYFVDDLVFGDFIQGRQVFDDHFLALGIVFLDVTLDNGHFGFSMSSQRGDLCQQMLEFARQL